MKNKTLLTLGAVGVAAWLLLRKKGGTLKGLSAAQAYPPPGSMYKGPEPAAPPGGWPSPTGTTGAAQWACLRIPGARWIGPAGKKWCQVPAWHAGAEGIVGHAVHTGKPEVSDRECANLKAAIKREEGLLADYRAKLAKRGCAV
jgi:hypothetical protein